MASRGSNSSPEKRLPQLVGRPQITRAAPKKPKKGIHTKWWEKDMENNMKNIKSQEDFDKQLTVELARPYTQRYTNLPECIQDSNFSWSTIMNRQISARGSMSMSCHCSTFTEVLKIDTFKDALKRHGVQGENLAAEKGLEESEHKSIAPPTDIPNASDASPNIDVDDSPIEANND